MTRKKYGSQEVQDIGSSDVGARAPNEFAAAPVFGTAFTPRPVAVGTSLEILFPAESTS